MPILKALGVLVLSYLIGSIPFGLIIVYLTNGKDIRKVESGRTGGTNAMRAAGTFAGVFTAVFDFLKGASAVWLARALLPGTVPFPRLFAEFPASLHPSLGTQAA